MKVCLDISSALAHASGVSRYTRELALALAGMNSSVRLSLFHNLQTLERLPAKLQHLERFSSPLRERQWRANLILGARRHFEQVTRAASFDIYHGPDCVTPATACARVITIHDLTTLTHKQYHSRFNRWYQRLALPIMVRRSTHVIADSMSTRNDIVHWLHVDARRISVVPLGIDHGLFQPVPHREARAHIASQFGIRNSYVLAVGTLEPRKNLDGLLRAMTQLADSNLDIVLVGGKGWGNLDLSALIQNLGLAPRTHLLGHVEDALLPVLYSGAAAYVYPSWYEGFGFPILEAMACRTPVVTSNTSSMPEVAGGFAQLVDPGSDASIAAGITRALDARERAHDIVDAAERHARTFTWHACAMKTLAVYESARSIGTASSFSPI